MSEHANAATCVGCGVERIGPGIEDQPGERMPCPECGEMGVALSRSLSDSAEIHEMLAHKVKGTRDGKRRVLQAGKNGHEYYRKDGRWHHVYRAILHEGDWYDEVVTDVETGEPVREIHEPLSQHQGRGSARPS